VLQALVAPADLGERIRPATIDRGETARLSDDDRHEAGPERAGAKPARPIRRDERGDRQCERRRRREGHPAAAVGEVACGAAQNGGDEEADPDQRQQRRDSAGDPDGPRNGRVEQARQIG